MAITDLKDILFNNTVFIPNTARKEEKMFNKSTPVAPKVPPLTATKELDEFEKILEEQKVKINPDNPYHVSAGVNPKPDKIKVSLFIKDFVHTIMACSRVIHMGVNKHGFQTWKTFSERSVQDAAFRHLMRYMNNEELDRETKEDHLIHAITNLAILYENRTKDKVHDVERCV